MNGLAAALLATTVAQALATLAVYMVPILAPAVARDLGVAAAVIGYQVAVVYGMASVTSLLSGSALARLGAAGCTQVALVAVALGSAAFALGGLAGAVLGSVLFGIGYGLLSPAAAQVLNQLAPPTRRNMVFSVKQMGVPIGGTLAGLLLPAMAVALGWRAVAGGVAVVLLLLALALTPLRAAWDGPGTSQAGASPAARLGTAAVLRLGRGLPALALTGALFSAVQLSLAAYVVTMLVGEFGWGVVAAGAAAAAIQASGATARLVWAALADRYGGGMPIMAVIGLGTAVAAIAVPFAPGWPPLAVFALLCLFGACTTGWTGVAMAEAARLAPPGAAGAAAGGVLAITFIGIVVGPTIFASIVGVVGSFSAAFAVMAALPLLGAALAWRTHRQAAPGRG